MRRYAYLCVVIVFLFSGLSLGQMPTPEDTGALEEFMHLLSLEGGGCLAFMGQPTPFGTGTSFVLPLQDKYCVYYYKQPYEFPSYNAENGYELGYVDAAPNSPMILRRLIEGWHAADCVYMKHVGPPELMPPHDAVLVNTPSSDYGVHLWINGDWGSWSEGVGGPPGFHTSSAPLNWDGEPHAFCYRCSLERFQCGCRCQDTVGAALPPPEAYLIFWEAGCPVFDYQWDDFWVALIPAK